MREQLNGDKILSPKQAEALRCLIYGDVIELLYGGAAGGGKTWLGCFWVWYMCRKYPRIRIVIARRHLKDISTATLPSFYKVCAAMESRPGYIYKAERFWRYNGSLSIITHSRNGAQIHFVDTEYKPTDPLYDRYGGQEYTCGWCEEVQETSRKAYNALRTRIGRQLNDEYGLKPMMLSTCNPSKGWIYTDFYLPFRDAKLPEGRAFIAATIGDNPYLSAEYRSVMENINDPVVKARLLEGKWEFEDDDSQLISALTLSNTLSAIFIPGPVRIGIDVALDGPRADKTVIAIVTGNRLERIEVISASEHTGDPAGFDLWLTERIFSIVSDYRLEPNAARIDYSGVGANIWQLLRTNFGLLCFPFKGGSPAIGRAGKMQKFANVRAQAWWELKEKIRLKQLVLPQSYDEELWQELTALRYNIRADVVQMEDKMYLRRRLGRSPDKADALMMACFDLPTQTGEKPRIALR